MLAGGGGKKPKTTLCKTVLQLLGPSDWFLWFLLQLVARDDNPELCPQLSSCFTAAVQNNILSTAEVASLHLFIHDSFCPDSLTKLQITFQYVVSNSLLKGAIHRSQAEDRASSFNHICPLYVECRDTVD